ncbi:LacI family DNA-binding transcriptional regulator [Marinimicrococcus flavescens]|uniref:LacI family DNA-binding transcriptional regulator n=1 Tax=Marinimicrococcus flavescens TaxID=3031815 RepID=A0AAP4D773_9PROT|nr:LacI family DNA-binding transcriptional regulator [Marinimicrococcus flavescens]
MSRRPTIRDVARVVGVSAATVSYALSGNGRVSRSLAAQVRETAAAMGYVPRHAAMALRTGRSALLGVVLPNIANPLFPALAQEIGRAARRRSYALLLADSLDEAAGQDLAVTQMMARGVDALIVVPRRGSTLPEAPLPLVVIDTAASSERGVCSDHREGGRLVARHLLGLGHRRILVLAGPENSRVAQERLAGLHDVLAGTEAAALTIRHTAYRPEGAAEAVQDLGEAGWTAVAAVSDTLAIGAVNALVARGIDVPGKVSVTGFDDLVWASIVRPELTTVRQNLARIAESAVAMALGEREPGEIVPVELVVRCSTATAVPARRTPAGSSAATRSSAPARSPEGEPA